jgi:dUTP pyrophosphatase
MTTRKENGSNMNAYKFLADAMHDVPTPSLRVKLDPGAKLPTRAHPSDAGFDLYSRETVDITPFKSYLFDTGVHIEIPHGYVGFIKSKSGLMVKQNIITDGTVDSGYTGSIAVKLFNLGGRYVKIEKGQKIAQLVIQPCELPELLIADHLGDTERGNGGFGSTGKF